MRIGTLPAVHVRLAGTVRSLQLLLNASAVLANSCSCHAGTKVSFIIPERPQLPVRYCCVSCAAATHCCCCQSAVAADWVKFTVPGYDAPDAPASGYL